MAKKKRPRKKWARMFSADGGDEAPPSENTLRQLLKEVYERNRISYNLGNQTPSERYNRQRHARNVAQRVRSELLGSSRPQFPKPVLMARYGKSPILDEVLPGRAERWLPVLERDPDQEVEIDLEKFSFIDDPAGTMRNLKKIAEVECSSVNARLHFRDPECLDMGAYLVLGEAWDQLRPFFRGGHMEPPVQKVMEAVGLRRLMRMRLRAVRDLKDVWAFPIRQRVALGARGSQKQLFEPQGDQLVVDELCDEISRWLGIPDPPHELTPQGKAWIAQILLELLDNAERHSDPLGKSGNWTVAAFMARKQRGNDWVYRCHLAILSVGATIHESLKTCSARVRLELDEYSRNHKNRGVSVETLRTVCALQDTITRDADADDHNRGGVGFQEVLRFAHELGGTSPGGEGPRLTVLSGTSCLMLRAPYILGFRQSEDAPRTLWFNPENSSKVMPSGSFAFDIEDRLGGTIISLAFSIDAKYLAEKIDGTNQSSGPNS